MENVLPNAGRTKQFRLLLLSSIPFWAAPFHTLSALSMWCCVTCVLFTHYQHFNTIQVYSRWCWCCRIRRYQLFVYRTFCIVLVVIAAFDGIGCCHYCCCCWCCWWWWWWCDSQHTYDMNITHHVMDFYCNTNIAWLPRLSRTYSFNSFSVSLSNRFRVACCRRQRWWAKLPGPHETGWR